MKTEFSDKAGTPVYVGDTVLYRLSDAGTLLKVVQTRKGLFLVSPQYADKYPGQAGRGSISMNKPYEKYISIIDSESKKHNLSRH